MKKYIFFVLLFALCINLMASSDVAEFLDIGVGARAKAMGNAFTAVADDITAAYWNPAGLASITQIETTMMMQSYSDASWPGQEDIFPSYQYLALAVPYDRLKILKNATLALSIISFTLDNVPYTYMTTSNRIYRSSFKDTETAYLFSIAYPAIPSSIHVGATAKLISQKFTVIDNASAFGWDIDAGMKIFLTERVTMGLLINKGAELKWSNGYVDQDELCVKLGALYDYPISEKITSMASVDFKQQKEMPMSASVGTSFKLRTDFGKDFSRLRQIEIRAGIADLAIENRYSYAGIINKEINWNYGVGMDLSVYNYRLVIDYAFDYERLGSKHLISIIIKI